MNVRRFLSLIVAVMAVLAGVSIWYVYAQEQYKWVISLEPTETYLLVPLTFKAYLYSSQTGEIYRASCNLVLMNATDVIWVVTNVTGAPAIYSFSIDKVGEYSLDYYCESGEQLAYGTMNIRIDYPEPRLIVYKSMWARPLEVGVETPYPYSNVTLNIYFDGSKYNATLQDGRAYLTLHPIYAPSDVVVELFDVNTTFSVTPSLPSLKINTSTTQIKIVSTATVYAYMEDELGTLNVSWPVTFRVEGPCNFENGEKTITTYTFEKVRVVPEAIAKESTCKIAATSYPWPGVVLYASDEITILPPTVKEFRLLYNNKTAWDYTFMSRVYMDTPVNGTLTLYINGVPVDEVKLYSTVFILTRSITFDPGVYTAYAVFRYLNVTLNTEPILLIIPKHKFTIEPPPSQVYAGEEALIPQSWLESGVYWRLHYPSNDTIVVYAEYPGSWYYYSASGVYTIKVIYPKIELHEDRITVENAAPGAIIKVYGYNGNESELIMEIYCRKANFTYEIPQLMNWDYVIAVYSYGDYRLAVTGNDPEAIEVLATRVQAGTPVVLLRESPKILYAVIGDRIYTPGEEVVLMPGYYTLKVYTTDGYELEFPVEVVPQKVVVAVYKVGNMWRIEVYGSENSIVHVVLANGRTIDLPPGTHYTSIEPVNAWYEYGDVEFMKFKTLSPSCGC